MKKKLPEPKLVPKTVPVVLVIDPASKSCGAAVFDLFGTPLQAFTLKSGLSNWGDRLADMREQLESMLFYMRATHNYEVAELVFERVPPAAHVGVPLVLGALLSAEGMHKVDVRKDNAVSPSTWKAWARAEGCPDKDPKGIPGLEHLMKNNAKIEPPPPDSDDAADALMIGMSWFARHPF